MKKQKLFVDKILIILSILFILIGTFLFIIFIINLDYSFWEPQQIENSGIIGDFIGGIVGSIWALVGVFLFFSAIKLQYRELKIVQRDSVFQNFENKFFELIKIHINNRAEITVGKKNKTGRAALTLIKDELIEIYRHARKLGTKHDIETSDIYNISFLILYYGITLKAWKDIFKNEIDILLKTKFERLEKQTNNTRGSYAGEVEYEEQKESHLRFISELREVLQENSKFSKKQFKPFNGNQHRLGPYFRHFFQSVKFVNNKNIEGLDFKTKYQYVKTLRAQLCSHEQIILFFNSMSNLGLPWERDPNLSNKYQKHLITKYNLIKNIPKGYLKYLDINVESHYPDVKFEWHNKKSEYKIRLEDVYE